MTTTNYRLPTHVVPEAYNVALHATPKSTHFAGAVILTLRLEAPTKEITLHARGLEVFGAKATAPVCQDAKVHPHTEHETITLKFKALLPRGRATVQLQFRGILNANMHGLYLAEDGPERAVVSQCQATDARGMFPCFDEPAFKATLQWTIVTDPGLTVITNGVSTGVSHHPNHELMVHTFAPTRVIPTYLAAVAIGAFDSTPTFKVGSTPCRVLAGRNKGSQTDFACAVTRQVLPWYSRYFAHPYNYQKLDQVAVPGFDAGAMENVGAIFYRQNLLLMDPVATSWQAKKRIAEVIAHEIAHQWFGNLVTMQWWDDLWLNEAFATWIAYKACDIWQPSWRMWDDYLESKESALGADALQSTHPIYTPVESPAEATELFDVITYEKGCAVLRMAEAFLGEEAFQQGIARYIAAHKNSNATGRDLWNAVEKSAKLPVASLMQSWVTQPGFPLVTVTLGESNGHTTLHMSQRRFWANAEVMQEAQNTQRWMVPVEIAYDTGNGMAVHHTLLSDTEQTVSLPKSGRARWVYPNARATGFFRVQLDPPSLQAVLRDGLTDLPPSARLGLLEDQWALVRCNLSHIGQFMDVLAAYGQETDYAVLRAMGGRLGYLREALVTDATAGSFAAFVRQLFGHHMEDVGWDTEPEESPTRSVRRAVVVDTLGECGDDAAILAEATRRVDEEMRAPQAFEPNLASVVVSLAALHGDEARLRRYVSTYLERKSLGLAPELQARYLHALHAFEDPHCAEVVLELCLDGTIPQEQLRVVLSPMLARRKSQLLAWAFIKKHWRDLGPRIGAMGVSRLIESTGALPVDERGDVVQFFAKNPVPEAKRGLQKALEGIDLRHALRTRESAHFSEWLWERQPRA